MGVQNPAVIYGPNGGLLLKGNTIEDKSGDEIFPNKANRNYLYNPEFRFIQRLDDDTNFSIDFDDDQYCFDQWIGLTSDGDANALEAKRIEGVVTGENNRFHAKLTQLDAVAARFGMVQFLPLDDIQHLRGKQLTFSFAHKTTSTEIVKLRAGIIEWTGTADAVTSDVVSSWAATPTLATSLAFLNTPAEITVSSTWATEDITATVGASANNLAVFVWTPDAEAQNDEFFLGNTQLVVGSKRVPWATASKPYTQDLTECQKFFRKTFDLDTQLGKTTTLGAHHVRAIQTGTNFLVSVHQGMFKTPVLAGYSSDTGTKDRAYNLSGDADITTTYDTIGENHARILLPGVTADNVILVHYTVEAEL